MVLSSPKQIDELDQAFPAHSQGAGHVGKQHVSRTGSSGNVLASVERVSQFRGRGMTLCLYLHMTP